MINKIGVEKILKHKPRFITQAGGKIKKEQSMSADMADILSNLYFGHCIEWYYGLNLP